MGIINSVLMIRQGRLVLSYIAVTVPLSLIWGIWSHPKESATSEGRGEGFELRTDRAGAIRSKGLYISTFVQNNATGIHLEAKKQFKTSQKV